MTLNEYQERAMRTCMPTCNDINYFLLYHVGDELAAKVYEAMRKGTARIDENDYRHDERMPADNLARNRAELKEEAGNIAWLLAGFCHAMGWKLEDICQDYLEKLEKMASRLKRGVIAGNGDNR